MNNKHINLFIMAGGVGSRFWPKSRNAFPKQFIDILGTGDSLLQLTYNRFKDYINNDNIHIVTNQDYKQLVHEQLPNLTVKNIICEPSRNNTAPCIAYSAFKLLKKDPNAIMIIVPSDHLILKESAYLNIIQDAVNHAMKSNVLVTLGISPTRPDTGYGYIQYDASDNEKLHLVKAFHEKPQLELAIKYIEEPDFLWNAGMFIWKAADIIEAFRLYSPDIYKLFDSGFEYYNTDNEEEFINNNYPNSPNVSIDYAVIEKATNVYTIPADIGWSDLGTWNSLYEISDKDNNNNVLIGTNKYEINNSNGCIISASAEKLVIIDGLDDYIIVDDDNVLLIHKKNREQEIKTIVNSFKDKGLNEYL
ncbi:mannose-1-phosphate guanylyltransferase [Albibacterium bauzanense]|uniref:mannose-1-phosphate guanylyltransferase n=1 Tax=Albibacterium bauzanense TaxID=653929 RepID=A0A4R1M165_9SPHI|nr:mannose-1-phosphate guanylyltransferase [Albibacterium bauzanense]TCK84952.1 mannose-1-phosphate guanylyltransferase [Albibacterium bauzanense]